MSHNEINRDYYNILCKVADLFIEKGCDNTSLDTLVSVLQLPLEEIQSQWHDTRDVLQNIFRFVWAKAVSRTREILRREKDHRDALSNAFADLFRLFLVDEPILGKCIILESHRYDKEKMRLTFLIPEVTEFFNMISRYVKGNYDAGYFISINPNVLLELFLSILYGMMSIWVIQEDIGYSSQFSVMDFETISRMLVSSFSIPPLEQSKIYYDTVAPVYDELYTDGISRAENSIVEDILKKNLKDGDRILDLGCGSGLGYALMKNMDYEYVGIDISSEMIHKAKAKYLGFNNASFLVMNMTDLSYFKRNDFDAVISLFGSFSHVVNYTKAIAEIERVLKPGGLIFIMVYSRYSIRNLFKTITKLSLNSLSEIQPYEIRKTSGSIFADARFYTAKSVRRAFERFCNIRIIGLNAFLELPLLRLPYLSQKRWIFAKRFLLKETKLLSRLPNLSHSLIIIGKQLP
jgi:ubiquinone/menaquinone biosynthesis C-methylase UbiE